MSALAGLHWREETVFLPKMDVFISHSSRDSKLAAELITLLEKALGLEPSAIRCTSVSGYKLEVGANTDATLRKEVHEAKILVGLLTPDSLASSYVLFELGARWGLQLSIAPLLARGASGDFLKGPLSGISALRADHDADLHQFLNNIACRLGTQVRAAAGYTPQLKKVVELSMQTGRVPEEHVLANQDIRERKKTSEKEGSTAGLIPQNPLHNDSGSLQNLDSKYARILTIADVQHVNGDIAFQLSRYHSILRDWLAAYASKRGLLHRPKFWGVTSCHEGSGATTIAIGLAIKLSERVSTLLVDMTANQFAARKYPDRIIGSDLKSVAEDTTGKSDKMGGHFFVVGDNRLLFSTTENYSCFIAPKLKASNFDNIIFDLPPLDQNMILKDPIDNIDLMLLVVESERTDHIAIERMWSLISKTGADVRTIFNRD